MEQDLIKVFQNEKFGNVRVVLIGEEKEPYFVGKDVTEILGYTNARQGFVRPCRWRGQTR